MAVQKRQIVSLGLNQMNRSEKVTQGNATDAAMTGDPFFPPAETTTLLTELKDRTNLLAEADANTATGSHESFAKAKKAENDWDTTMRKVGSYVQNKADASPENGETIIRAAALRPKAVSEKQKPPKPVDDVQAMVTGYGDAIKLKLTTTNPYGTRYEIEMTTNPDDAASWTSIAQITSRKLLVQGLNNGVRYYFRTRAINNLGKSIYTNVVSQIAA